NITGDAYTRDGDGYFFYQARTDDMIISAGYNIAGPEVEGVLLVHEAVSECGVVGVPDEDRGQVVKAYVVLKAGYARSDALAKDFAGQFRQALRNVMEVLAQARGRPEHIVRLTWYVVDRGEYLAALKPVGQAYREIMGGHYPAMSVVQVSGLVEVLARLEIEAT